ncbi:MAG TPA: TonB family protein [Vicinamibacteria bacterium]|nr:TonB family protein [Vicinamibacteria bacterium]
MTPHQFGRYEVQGEIGQGAMGRVYKAFDPLANRTVAIKAIKDEILAQDESGEYLKRFQREARAAGGLSHPNIITIFDVGENYFVMEYLDGKSLLSVISERGALSLEETLQIVSPVADALEYAHRKGVFHRDIKPGNIMLMGNGRPVVTDFGLAHLESTVLTTAGQFLGSPSYMAPEQIVGEPVTYRSDLFSLSIVTYEMLTGRKPFPGDNVTTVVYKVVHSPPVPPQDYNPKLPRDYEGVFARALAKKPDERFGTFSEFVAALNLEAFEQLGSVSSSGSTSGGALTESSFGAETVGISPPLGGPAVDESTASITERQSRSRQGGLPRALAGVGLVALLAVVGSLAWLPNREVLMDAVVQTSPPGADVWIDGSLKGVSPLTVESLAAGEHSVRVAKDGFLPFEDRFELAAGSKEPLSFALQPARMSLFMESVPTGATVKVDGHSIGQTPIEDAQLEPGQHEIEVVNDGYASWDSVVVAQAGETVNLVAHLRLTAKPKDETPRASATRKTKPGDLIELGPGDPSPKRVSGEPPAYPAIARRLNQQGRVTVEFVLDENGVPTELQVIESAGEVLDAAVLESLSTWRYEPAQKDGVKVRVKMRVRQSFRLGSR